MVESASPAPACTRSAAPDRHRPKGPVPPALCPFGPRGPASAARAHAGTAAADSTISPPCEDDVRLLREDDAVVAGVLAKRRGDVGNQRVAAFGLQRSERARQRRRR